MARNIIYSEKEIDALVNKFRTELLTTKWQDEFKDYSLPLKKDNRKAKLWFSAKAWIKMNRLVSEFSTEIQWHGTVTRTSENIFFVDDILVFPHEVTSTTVTSKQDEYEAWLDTLDDKIFNMLRFHGHSHVRMPVYPSGIDIDVQGRFLKGLGKPVEGYDPFYIFLIINKSGEMHCQIYDVTNNAKYTTDEITIDVYVDGHTNLTSFIKNAKKLTEKSTLTEYVRSTPQKWSEYSFERFGG